MYPHSRHCHSCFHCHPRGYIRMVQNLIERCLLLHMSRDECVKALAQHANIRPLITLTVWRELQKENREFFRAYFLYAFSHKPLLGTFRRTAPRARMMRRIPYRYWSWR